MSNNEIDIFRMCKDALRGISQLKKTMTVSAINDLQNQIDKPRPVIEQPKPNQPTFSTITLPKSMSIPLTLLEQDGAGRSGQRRMKRFVQPVNYRQSESQTNNEEMEIEQSEEAKEQQSIKKDEEIKPSIKPSSKPKVIEKVEKQKKQASKKSSKPLRKSLSQTPYPTIQQKIREKFGKPIRRAWIKRRRSNKHKKEPFSWRQVHDSYGNFNKQNSKTFIISEQEPDDAQQRQKIMQDIELRVLKFVQRQFMIGDKINIKNLQLKADKIASQYELVLPSNWLQQFNKKLLVGSYTLVVDLTKG